MVRLVFLLLVAQLVACVDALSAQDITRLHDAQSADLRIYQLADVDGVSRAFARVAFCLVEATLLSNSQPPLDSKGAIVCVKVHP